MKLTDFSLIFIGVTLPIIIVVYINISYVIKAEEQEMYYQKIVDSAVQDATNQMKEVENTDTKIDYGYSGVWDKKVSVNAQAAVDTFLNSLYNNFNINGNIAAERYLQLFIPAIAIVDYNGVQVSSIESYTLNGEQVESHVLKPKRYYTYTYAIVKDASQTYGYRLDDSTADIETYKNTSGNCVAIHTIEFTMDDYISNRGTYFNYTTSSWQDIPIKGFYTSDSANNSVLFDNSTSLTGDRRNFVTSVIVPALQSKRKDVIADTVKNEMAYAVNKNNSYARAANVNYNFIFPQIESSDWYSDIENVGIIAFMQGLSVGNKHLNYKAYGLTRLEEVTKYYLTTYGPDSKYKMNLYHSDTNCPEYKVSIKCSSPEYVLSRQQAASAVSSVIDITGQSTGKYFGFSPCPICNP